MHCRGAWERLMRQFIARPSATLYFWENQSMQFKLSDLNRSIVKVQLLQDVSSVHYDYKINNAADAAKLVGPELRKLDREYLLAIGCLTEVPVHPREILKSAILANAHSFILVHNHLRQLADDEQPTRVDHYITEEMIEAGRLMLSVAKSRILFAGQIPLKDHVIIGKGWYSFFERYCGNEGLFRIFDFG